MAGKPARWTDAGVAPTPGAESGTYSGDIQGPVRRAPLRDARGVLLGHVWTDDKKAAGFRQEQSPASVAAAAAIWRIHARLHAAGRPASDVLDPALYAPTYRLDDVPSRSGQRVDNALRRAARKK
jgi:hypothetical protein